MALVQMLSQIRGVIGVGHSLLIVFFPELSTSNPKWTHKGLFVPFGATKCGGLRLTLKEADSPGFVLFLHPFFITVCVLTVQLCACIV